MVACDIVVLLSVENDRNRPLQPALHPETDENEERERRNRAAGSAKTKDEQKTKPVALFGRCSPLAILIDARPLDLRFQCLPWIAKFLGGAGWSRYAAMALGESRLDHFDFAICKHRHPQGCKTILRLTKWGAH